MTTEEKETKQTLAEQAADAGIDLKEVAQLLQPLIDLSVAKTIEPMMAQSVAKTLNDMKLGDIITSTIEEKVKARTDAIGAEVKTLLEQIKASQQQQAVQTQAEPAQQGNPTTNAILAAIAQKVIGGGGGDGGDALDKALDRMLKLQAVGATMYQNPLAQAITMLTTMMKTAYSMGLEPKQVMEGMEKLGEPPKPTT